MILKDLVILSNFDDMWDYLISEYADHDNEQSRLSYLTVFEKLVDLEPTESDVKIGLTYSDEHIKSVICRNWSVSGYKENVAYAIDFTPWSEWLGMEIAEETLGKLEPHEIVVHCIWEMTFVSFDEEKIKYELNEIEKAVEDLEGEMNEGLFWVICRMSDGKINWGEDWDLYSIHPIDGDNISHKNAWMRVQYHNSDKCFRCDYNYYPRGRVVVRNSKATIFLNQHIVNDEVVAKVCNTFGLTAPKIHAEGGEHYKCYIDMNGG